MEQKQFITSELECVSLNSANHMIHIHDLNISSREVFDYFLGIEGNECRELEFQRAVEIGVAVLQRVELVSNTDYFDKRVVELTNSFETKIDDLKNEIMQTISEKFDPAEAKSYTKQLNDFFLQQRREFQSSVKEAVESISHQNEELQDLIDGSFNSDDQTSPLGKLAEKITAFKKDVEQNFDPNNRTSLTGKLAERLDGMFSESGTFSAVLEKRFSSTNPESPLVKFKEEIRKDINELRIEMARNLSAIDAKNEAIQKSPEKGFVFEEILFELLQELARTDGDIVTDVSKEIGETKRKSGDFTYDVSKLGKRIVIEARSRAITSVKSALGDLESSMQNRGAEYGIYLVETENQLQKQIGIWNEYPDGMIVTHSALIEVAIKVAKARLALERAESSGIDVTLIENQLTKLNDSMKKLSSIKKQVTSIKTSGVDIERLAGDIQTDVASIINDIKDELNRNASSSGEGA